MSYDVYIEIDTGLGACYTVEEVGNYTSNVRQMWDDALGYRLSSFDGVNCAAACPLLQEAVRRLKEPANQERYRAMEPTNGWGDLHGATEYLDHLWQACRRHPQAKIRISY